MSAGQAISTSMSRVVLVTGGAQGIGEAIAKRLANEGFDVAVADVPAKLPQLEAVATTVRAQGRRALALVGDVTKETDVEAFVKDTVTALGSLDVTMAGMRGQQMVANAGLFSTGLIVDMSVEQWDTMQAVNVRGVMLSVKHAARQMIAQGRGGTIITAASVAAQRSRDDLSMYCASKFAVRAITQAAAQELKPHGINVLAYAPGFIKTPLIVYPEDSVNGKYMTVKKKLGLPDNFPVGELSTIENLVSYMVTPEAWKHSGHCLNMVDDQLVADELY